jgi:hypothetical protein
MAGEGENYGQIFNRSHAVLSTWEGHYADPSIDMGKQKFPFRPLPKVDESRRSGRD